MKKIRASLVSLVMVGTMSVTTFAQDTSITDNGNSGESTINMVGTTIPSPTYTLIIPEKLDFGEITKKLKTVSEAEAKAKTAVSPVTIKYSNLFSNQKNLTVTISTDNKIIKDTDSLTFKLYEKEVTTDKEITSGTNLFTIEPTSSDIDVMAEKNIYATLDQRSIKASGDYKGIVTFKVTIADNK